MNFREEQGRLWFDIGACCATNDLETATDRLFDYVDRLMTRCNENGDWQEMDSFLWEAPITEFPPELLRGIATITAPCSRHVPLYRVFHELCRHRMAELRGQETADRLIRKLPAEVPA